MTTKKVRTGEEIKNEITERSKVLEEQYLAEGRGALKSLMDAQDDSRKEILPTLTTKERLALAAELTRSVLSTLRKYPRNKAAGKQELQSSLDGDKEITK